MHLHVMAELIILIGHCYEIRDSNAERTYKRNGARREQA